MNLNSIAYAPIFPQLTRLDSAETHFYSFAVTEAQKQRLGYQPLSHQQYLCHFTDRRLILERQSSVQDSQKETAAALIDPEKQVVQFDYKTIAAFKVVRTLNGSYARIQFHADDGEKAIVFAVSEAGARKRSCAGDFVRLGRDFLNGGLSQVFEFDPQAVSRFNQEVQASAVPVLVSFWASDCKPCQLMKPVIDQIETQFDGRLKLLKINVEENFSIPLHYNVNCFPTLLLFKTGTVAERISGTVSGKTLAKVLNLYLAA